MNGQPADLHAGSHIRIGGDVVTVIHEPVIIDHPCIVAWVRPSHGGHEKVMLIPLENPVDIADAEAGDDAARGHVPAG